VPEMCLYKRCNLTIEYILIYIAKVTTQCQLLPPFSFGILGLSARAINLFETFSPYNVFFFVEK